MKNQFETFIRPKERMARGKRVSITKGGFIIFYKDLTNYIAQAGKSVVFYYDHGNKVIGLEIAKKKNPNAYKVSPVKPGKISQVSARAFFRHYSILHEKSFSLDAEVDNETGYILIDLKKKENRGE
jgi:hypothetical protein